MNVDELFEMEPTLSEFASQSMMFEIATKDEWRYYGSTLTDDSYILAERFLKNHARLPGVISEEIYARKPAAVFYWSQEDNHVKGGLFLNGAVTISYYPSRQERHVSLFIDDATAQRLGYPEEGYTFKPLEREDTDN